MVRSLVDPLDVADEATTGTHARRYHRRTAVVPVVLRLVDDDGRALAKGTALISNITPVGAWLTQLDLGGAGIPLGNFRVAFRVISGEHAGAQAVCRPVRARFGKQTGLGVVFQHLRVAV